MGPVVDKVDNLPKLYYIRGDLNINNNELLTLNCPVISVVLE